MHVSLATEPAHADRANEDFVAATSQAVVLLDGVGTGETASGCIHGTPWYVHQLGTALLTLLTNRFDDPLADLLAEAISTVRSAHADTCNVDHPGTPSTTVILVRHRHSRLDYLVLADSVLLLDTATGPWVITDERERTVARRLRSHIDQIPNGTPEHDRALRDFMTNIAAYRNQPDGFWCAAARSEAAHEAISGTVDLENVRRAAALSDGAARLVDRFGQTDWPQLLDIIDNDPADLIRRTREVEHSDPHGERWPRGKATDDAAIAYMTGIHDAAERASNGPRAALLPS